MSKRIKLPPVDPRPPDVVLGEAIANAYADDLENIDIGDGDSFAWIMVDVFRNAARLLKQRGQAVTVYALWRLTGKRNPAKAGAGRIGGLAASRKLSRQQLSERGKPGGRATFGLPDERRATAYGRELRARRSQRYHAK